MGRIKNKPKPTSPMPSGKFIVFEGVEGSGKSTQVRLLSEWLTERGIAHTTLREPGGTPLGEAVRRILLDGDELTDRAELLLFLAARNALVDQRIVPELASGKIVVADRYSLSTLAYQSYGRGLDLAEVRQANAFATRGLTPDVTILLDVTYEAGARRRADAGRSDDRIERAGADFHERVARAYGLLSSSEPGVEVVVGTGSPEDVRDRVIAVLTARFPETFLAGRVY
jgi:dTMP kinase